MNIEIKDTGWPDVMARCAKEQGCALVRCCRVNGWLQCFVTVDAGLWHLSVSHPRRYPTWDEIKAVRYALLPDERTFAILFPPMAQYVNVHPNCFHLHEVPELHERVVERPNDPSSATRHAGRNDCKPRRHAGFAAAHG